MIKKISWESESFVIGQWGPYWLRVAELLQGLRIVSKSDITLSSELQIEQTLWRWKEDSKDLLLYLLGLLNLLVQKVMVIWVCPKTYKNFGMTWMRFYLVLLGTLGAKSRNLNTQKILNSLQRLHSRRTFGDIVRKFWGVTLIWRKKGLLFYFIVFKGSFDKLISRLVQLTNGASTEESDVIPPL